MEQTIMANPGIQQLLTVEGEELLNRIKGQGKENSAATDKNTVAGTGAAADEKTAAGTGSAADGNTGADAVTDEYNGPTESAGDFIPWDVYPRPQLRRDSYTCLNGMWKFRSLNNDCGILVPFCPESLLSTVEGEIEYGETLRYERQFTLEKKPGTGRIILHFGAVSREACVVVNGIEVCRNNNAYLPFSVDITEAVKSGVNTLCVEVENNLSTKYPYGKQKKDRGGMWYTPCSGIWQTVWMETVPQIYIKSLKIDVDDKAADIVVNLEGNAVMPGEIMTAETYALKQKESSDKTVQKAGEGTVSGDIYLTSDRASKRDRSGKTDENGKARAGALKALWNFLSGSGNAEGKAGGKNRMYAVCEGKEYPVVDGKIHIEPEEKHLWSPEDPYLYNVTIYMGEDTVETYFALRKLEIKEFGGIKRLCLNGKPYFFNALLDQGYFSDGLYTPAVPALYEQDITRMKALGFNTLRKHIKVEPEQFYYDCDRLGMVVFQDMVNNGVYNYVLDTVFPNFGLRGFDRIENGRPSVRKNFREAMIATVKHLYNHPCICYWTVFNEGWGQFDADGAFKVLKKYDTSRFADATSGWFKRKESDVESLHIYFKKLFLGSDRERPQVISEFGGYVYKNNEHSFNKLNTYGYKIYATRSDFVAGLRKLYEEELLPLVKQGLCAAVYTQVSDVEDETNGILTYDRRVSKVEPEQFADIGAKLQAAVAPENGD